MICTRQGLWVPAWDDIWEQWVDHDLQFERHVLDLLLEAMPRTRDRVAIDVGAHVGTDTIRLARNFRVVHAFEPHPENHACLRRNVAALSALPDAGDVVLHECALGAAPGTCELRHHGGNCGEYTVAPGSDVRVETLDSHALADVDAMKIDVEGYELRVLEGARDTLLRCRPIIVLEVGEPAMRHHGISRLAACEYLEDLGARKTGEDPTGGNWRFEWIP
jgi:FkbM family methyltransferase